MAEAALKQPEIMARSGHLSDVANNTAGDNQPSPRQYDGHQQVMYDIEMSDSPTEERRRMISASRKGAKSGDVGARQE